VKIPCLFRPTTRVSRRGLARLGGAGSLATAIANKKRQPDVARYAGKNTNPCTACSRGQHHKCFSLHCPCKRCNPEVKL
jgi:hypothetical protein